MTRLPLLLYATASLHVLALATGHATAQTQPMLIGITRLAPLSVEQDVTSCQIKQCTLALPGAAMLSASAGGTAYDATRGAVWHTNGALIGQFDPATCQTVCAPFPVPVSTANAIATGLAYNESTNRLFITDSQNVIGEYKASCGALSLASQCQPFLPANNFVIGGIATSDVHGLVFYAASDWAAANPNNTLFIAKQSTPCAYCKVAVPACSSLTLGPITGVACDDAKDLVWVTDGFLTVGLAYTMTGTSCALRPVQCCRLPVVNDRLMGLCLEPSHASRFGQSCTRPVCANCPAMAHDTLGDAALGNPSFALVLNNAPAGASSFLVMNAGACGPGPMIGLFCGPINVPLVPPPILLGPIPTGGSAGCTGNAAVALSIPLNPSLCAIPIASQYLVICQSTVGLGTGVSNCLTWMISGT